MFDPAKVLSPPAQNEIHFWADYVEMLCMIDPDGEYSADRLATDRGFAADFKATSPDAQDADFDDVADALVGAESPTEDLFGAIDEYGEQELDGDDVDDVDRDFTTDGNASSYGRAAEVMDNKYQWSKMVFEYLKGRETLLGARYPFVIDSRAMSIKRDDTNPNSLRYVFLLCCSLLKYLPGSIQRLTKLFEVVSFTALRALLAESAEVDLYGTSQDHVQSRFTGTPFERLTGLAAEIGSKVIVSKSDFNPKDHGDNGMDIVAWFPMGDNAAGSPTFFAQCACGVEWERKQFEASYQRLSQFLQFKSPPATLTFIPFLFRRPGGEWYADSDVSSILMDRHRILAALGATDIPDAAASFAQEAWDSRRDLS